MLYLCLILGGISSFTAAMLVGARMRVGNGGRGGSKGDFLFALHESSLDTSSLVGDLLSAIVFDSTIVVSLAAFLPVALEANLSFGRGVAPYPVGRGHLGFRYDG